MSKFDFEDLTPFGRLAVQLDHDFSELTRLSGQIQRLDIQTDAGLDRAVELLNEFTRHGQAISDGIQGFSQSLQTARETAETAAKSVSARAQEIQSRKEEQNRVQGRLANLGQEVKSVTAALGDLKKATVQDLPKARIQELDARLGEFIDEARSIQEEAAKGRMKSIARDAESLFGTLQSARKKLGSVTSLLH